ncbi:MAG: universal stress protein [Labilithrix sp.]|nr:universal stress protein [Labilithrix sp.]
MAPPRSILFATDLSCRCDRALDRTVALAGEWRARVIALHVLERPSQVIDAPSWRRADDPRRVAERRMRADLGVGSGVELELIVERGDAAALVLDAAQRHDCELIVTGVARDETLGRVLLGRTVENVVRRATVPVLVVKSRPREPYRNIIVATDFSETSRAGLATTLAMFPTSQVTLFHAYDVPHERYVEDRMAAREGYARAARLEAEAFLAGVPSLARERTRIVCEYGTPEALLRDLADGGMVDLVVAGTRGRGRIAELFLGSVAQSLLRGVPGDVMIVPRGA